MHNTIGTEKDSRKFRTEIATLLNNTSENIRLASKDIEGYMDASNVKGAPVDVKR